MSIQSEINRIAGNIAAAYDAAEEKGAEMPENLTSDNLAETIATITGGGTISSPTYTYTGDSSIVIDDGGWKLRLLTRGTLNFSDLGGAQAVDIFLVGGGGGSSSYDSAGGNGGGGGYTKTETTVLAVGEDYEISIGAGGEKLNDGGSTGITGPNVSINVEGGKAGANKVSSSIPGHGGNGGSGGGGHSQNGGSNGGDGGSGSIANGGRGQGNPPGTREFWEPDGALYAGGGAGGKLNGAVALGGAGGGGDTGENGAVNTGGGGGGGYATSGSGHAGGSGILIIRNHRGATV